MLIRFTVENYLSFNQRIDFNMIASDNSSHPHHIVKEAGDDFGLLKSSVIYGANASGKSNLIKAMDFARSLIVDGVEKNRNIGVKPFRLNRECLKKPSRFEFEFRTKGRQYAYGFSVDRRRVLEEWLVEIGSEEDINIYERTLENVDINFEHPLFSDITEKRKTQIEYEFENTRDNFLFLCNTQERKIPEFVPVYDWFAETLTIIFPNSRVSSPVNSEFNKILSYFDNKIISVRIEEDTIDFLKFADEFDKLDDVDKLDTTIKFGKFAQKLKNHIENPDSVLDVQDEIVVDFVKAIDISSVKNTDYIFVRKDKNGEEVPFRFSEESSGIQRLFDLVPVLIKYKDEESVLVIDEIENNLHPLLIKKMFDFILNNETSKFSKSQIICSTHEVQLLDIKKLLRKDEIWFIEKNNNGESIPYSLASANVDGLDLIRGYLNGRFGAIPFIPNVNEMGWGE